VFLRITANIEKRPVNGPKSWKWGLPWKRTKERDRVNWDAGMDTLQNPYYRFVRQVQ